MPDYMNRADTHLSLVKHKKKPKTEPQASGGTNGDAKGKGKRTAEDAGSEDELAGDSKRAKTPAS